MNRSNVIFLLKSTASNDDREAFRLLFHHYYERLVQFAKLFVSTRCRAEDAVSEVLIRLFRIRSSFFVMENFEHYLFRSVKNEALNKLKSERHAYLHHSELALAGKLHDRTDPHETLIGDELYGQINDVIGRLPAKRQKVYRLIKNDGLRYREVARLMDISERTVEVHLKIAVREVRCAIDAYLRDGG
jgi:RNA polymerase sigma-70 factor (family 1)